MYTCEQFLVQREKTMAKFIGYHKEHEEALYFRKELIIRKTIQRATLRLSALGIVKGFCNGLELDSDLLTPGWTNYNQRIPYYIFNIKEHLQMVCSKIC